MPRVSTRYEACTACDPSFRRRHLLDEKRREPELLKRCFDVCFTQDYHTSRTSETTTETSRFPYAGIARPQLSACARERLWYGDQK